jgi:hypothetical protein
MEALIFSWQADNRSNQQNNCGRERHHSKEIKKQNKRTVNAMKLSSFACVGSA